MNIPWRQIIEAFGFSLSFQTNRNGRYGLRAMRLFFREKMSKASSLNNVTIKTPISLLQLIFCIKLQSP